MDYAKALTFITEDPRWKEKIAIGGGVALISILLSFILIGVIGFLIISGYAVRLLQNVRDGKTHPLPEWDAWGDDLVRGFKFLVVSLVWSLPAIIFTIPSTIGGMLTEGGGSAETVGGIIVFCATCLVSLYSLFVALVSPGFTIGFATDERIGSGLQFTKIWNWTQQNIPVVSRHRDHRRQYSHFTRGIVRLAVSRRLGRHPAAHHADHHDLPVPHLWAVGLCVPV